jgi:hypothetical protein
MIGHLGNLRGCRGRYYFSKEFSVKTVLSIAMILCLAGLAMAADVTGKWVSERKMTPPGGGEERTMTTTMDLKADGSKLTGTVATSMGDRQGRASEITDGKIDGSKISFKVTREGKQGTMTMIYEATLEGDTLKGEAWRDGGDRKMPFEAKRAK